MKIAMFKRMGVVEYETVGAEALDGCRDYVRITEYVDVEFKRITNNECIEKQLDALNRTETELRNKFQYALNGIERQRAELMALPNLEQSL